METITSIVTSQDGTKIAYDKIGHGPAVILVAGALCSRSFWSGPELAKLLARSFTVYNYDRRGRGDSGDTKPYAVAREIEDIEALIDEAGGSAYLYGHSSGAALALEAALRLGNTVKKLAMYEAPYNDDAEAQRAWKQYIKQLTEALAADRRGDAVALFMELVAPTLVMNGGASYAFMYDTAQALGKAIPNAQVRTLKGQTHDVDLDVLAPVLMEFFSG